MQREKRTLQGLVRKEQKQKILDLHRNAQRLLRKLAVVNPYADQLTFLDDRTRTRRDHEKYLTLIDTIALLHQFQRPVKSATVGGAGVEYIEVTLADIEAANRLAHEVLGRSLDELPPQTRRVLAALHGWVEGVTQERQMRRADVRFTRSDVRRVTSLSDTQCCIHVERLIALEYVLVHRGTRGQSFEYELLYDGAGSNGAPFVVGLIEVQALRNAGTTASSRGRAGRFTGPSRADHGGDPAPLRSAGYGGAPSATGLADELPGSGGKTHATGAADKAASYPPISLAAAAVSAG
ncbi:hypothetical protein LP419_38565 [Massilia sp. H-1]|nr:hypothetical protein LP419_38565 [Massilia sp. H-1]